MFVNVHHLSKAFKISSIVSTSDSARNFACYFIITSCVFLCEEMHFTFVLVSVIGIIL